MQVAYKTEGERYLLVQGLNTAAAETRETLFNEESNFNVDFASLKHGPWILGNLAVKWSEVLYVVDISSVNKRRCPFRWVDILKFKELIKNKNKNKEHRRVPTVRYKK